MSFLEFNDFEDNYFFGSGNDNNMSFMFQDNKEFPDSISLNDFLSFKLEEPQQDIPNKDNHHNMPEPKGIELNEEYDVFHINPIQNDEDPFIKRMNDKPKQKPESNKKISSTGPTSDKKSKIKIKKVDKFTTKENSLPNYWRFDMVKKHFKSKISDFGTDLINRLIQDGDLPEEFKKIIIHKPNSLLFTANVKVADNYNFLNDTLRTIYTIGKETEDLQKQNDENITNIYGHFEKVGHNNLSDNLKAIKSFFDMSYKDLIINFYNSYEFTNFKEDDKTKFYDEGTIRQEGFSVLEDYGLIKIFMMIKKKRKRD